MGLSHNSTEMYYKFIFTLTQFHNWSITEIENLYPFEREAYSYMLQQVVEERQRKLEEQKLGR